MEPIKSLADSIQAKLNELGQEVNDPRPVFIAGPSEHMSINEKIDRVLANRISIKAHERGLETFEEANDFDVQDPFEVPDPETPYTLLFEDIPEGHSDEEEEVPQETEPTTVESTDSSEESD